MVDLLNIKYNSLFSWKVILPYCRKPRLSSDNPRAFESKSRFFLHPAQPTFYATPLKFMKPSFSSCWFVDSWSNCRWWIRFCHFHSPMYNIMHTIPCQICSLHVEWVSIRIFCCPLPPSLPPSICWAIIHEVVWERSSATVLTPPFLSSWINGHFRWWGRAEQRRVIFKIRSTLSTFWMSLHYGRRRQWWYDRRWASTPFFTMATGEFVPLYWFYFKDSTDSKSCR